jgi:hypothetical protein
MTSCSAISGATSQSYPLAATTRGYYVAVVVTATDAGGATSGTPALVGTVSVAPQTVTT